MKISDKQKKKAAEIIAKLNCKELFMNDKGEFFTNKSLAAHSVDGKKDRYADVSSFRNQETSGSGTATVEELIVTVSEATTVDAVQLILDEENKRSKPRKTVTVACEKKIAELNEIDD